MTIDKDLTFFGLEPEDIVVVVIISFVIMFLVDPISSIVFGFGAVFFLRKLKEGKPPGHMFYLLYKTGILPLMPSFFSQPHMVRPPTLAENLLSTDKIVRFSCIGDEDEDPKNPYEEFYWSGRKTM